MDLDAAATQEVFAVIVGVSQQKVSQLIAEGVIARDGTVRDWLAAYCERLREQAAGRGQELTAARASLARSQREGQDLKNARARKSFAPVELLGAVLAAASGAMAARLAAFPHEVRVGHPELSDEVCAEVDRLMADAHAEWLRTTQSLTVPDADGEDDDAFDGMGDEDDGSSLADDDAGNSSPVHSADAGRFLG